MENSTAENEETKLAVDADDQEKQTEENYRQEIEDIVRGFIIEKDILAQSHEEEINRMKRRFDVERKELLKQLEIDKEQIIETSRITQSAATTNEVNIAVSDTFISDAGRKQSFCEGSTDRALSSFHRRSNGGYDIDEVDTNLIREIAEVYLRINNGTLTSQIRPDLDLEDKYESEREALERSFQLEKRELKRRLEEDYHRNLEQERMKYEATIADLKTTISELQWQRREAENRLRHEKEKWEMAMEREKNETEKRNIQLIHDNKRKLEEKHSSELDKQRERYEENISDLQTDISKLTMQLKELNENLNHEKEIIMSKFEREIKEMEQAFLEQRNSLKANYEAEFVVRLENETSLLKALNIKLKEDLENMEKEKKDVEKRGKEERRKLEERFEEEITELEQRQSEEKRSLKIKLEERYQLGLVREKGGLEETIQELSEEITLLRQENEQMETNYAERREDLQRQLEMEREDMRRKIISEREEIRIRVEKELSQKFMLEKGSQNEGLRHHERDVLIIQAKYDDLEMQMVALRQEKEMLLRDKINLEENLRSKEKRLMELNNGRMPEGVSQDGSARLKEIIREKDNELASVKFENQQLELTLSAMRREKSDLEDEILNLKRQLSKSTEQFVSFGYNDSEMASAQESMKRKDGEMSSLQREKRDIESRLSSLQRKNDELEDEISSLRRKKLDVEDEISALKRDKTESDNQVVSLKRDKAELEELIANFKRRQGDLEELMSAMKREKVELEHEISILKRQNSTLEIEVHRQFSDQQENTRTVLHKHEHEHVTRGTISPRTTHENIAPRVVEIQYEAQNNSVFDDKDEGYDMKLKMDASEMQQKISDLARQRNDLESAVRRLSNEKADLEKDLRMQLEHRRKVDQLEEDNFRKKEESEASLVLQRQKDGMGKRIASLKKEEVELESKVCQYQREADRLKDKINDLQDERSTLEKEIKSMKFEKQSVEKAIENAIKDKEDQERDEKRQVRSGSPRLKGERTKTDHSGDQQVDVLRRERDALRTELTNLKRQLTLLQTELSTKTVHVYKESIEMDEKEISELKVIRVELEREIAVLHRTKTELEAQFTAVKEVSKREENELNDLRRERMELELQITSLQSQNTRLKAEGSVLKDERHEDESEVDRLRREKADLEKDVFSLQIKNLQFQTTTLEDEGSTSRDDRPCYDNGIERLTREEDVFRLKSEKSRLEAEKADLENDVSGLQAENRRLEGETSVLKDQREKEENELASVKREKADLEKDIFRLQSEKYKLEADVSVAEEAREIKTSTSTGLQKNLQEITEHLENLQKQKEELQLEITLIQTTKERDQKEVQELRSQKSEIEIHLSELRMEYSLKRQDQKLDAAESVVQDTDDTRPTQEQLEIVKQDLEAEITKIRTFKTHEEGELRNLRQQKSEMEIEIRDLRSQGMPHEIQDSEFKPEKYDERNERELENLTDDEDKSEKMRSCECGGGGETKTFNGHNSVSYNRYGPGHNDGTEVQTPHSSHHDFHPSQTLATSTPLSSPVGFNDISKVDNDVMSLKRERSELESQICDIRIQLTSLQTEVTSLENRKTILETMQRSCSTDGLTTAETNGYRVADVDINITRPSNMEDRKDILIQEYEEQIRELKQKKVDLEQKVSVLEWQLENMKQKLELQEISHRREISTLNEKNQSFHGFQSNGKDDTLQEFYMKLSYFLMSGEHSNKEIMEEIERQISSLQEKAEFDFKNTKEYATSPRLKLEKDKVASETDTTLARGYASQLRAQMETADTQLKTCEKIINRLYGENTDLTKQNLNLEGKLKSASRSQEKLQRKKVLLQKLVDKLSGHMGKDAVHQSYLVFELDKDVSI